MESIAFASLSFLCLASNKSFFRFSISFVFVVNFISKIDDASLSPALLAFNTCSFSLLKRSLFIGEAIVAGLAICENMFLICFNSTCLLVALITSEATLFSFCSLSSCDFMFSISEAAVSSVVVRIFAASSLLFSLPSFNR